MDLYSAFLVLMTQSALQYSFTFTQSHTHSYSASISSTLLFYEAQFGVQHLAQGHFGMQIFFGRLGIELPTFRLEDDRSTPCKHQRDRVGNTLVFAYHCRKPRNYSRLQQDVSEMLQLHPSKEETVQLEQELGGAACLTWLWWLWAH